MVATLVSGSVSEEQNQKNRCRRVKLRAAQGGDTLLRPSARGLKVFPAGVQPLRFLAVGQNHGSVNSPPILGPILVMIGMFTGGTIWILTHGHLGLPVFVSTLFHLEGNGGSLSEVDPLLSPQKGERAIEGGTDTKDPDSVGARMGNRSF